MKKNIIMLLIGMILLGVKARKELLTSASLSDIIYYITMAVVFLLITINEILKGKECEKEKILSKVEIVNLEKGDKVLFKFDKNITNRDMEKYKKVLLSVFNGCDILAVSEGLEIQKATGKGSKDDERNADTKNTASDTIYN